MGLLGSVAPNENIGGGLNSGSFVAVAPKENFGATDSSDFESSKLIFGAVLDSNVSDFATGDFVFDKSTFGSSANEITGLSVSDLCSS